MPAAGWVLHCAGQTAWVCSVGFVLVNNGVQAGWMPDCLDLYGGQHG